MTKKNNYMIVIITIVLFSIGYIICKSFFSKAPNFSYTAEWTSRHHFLFIWVVSILFAVFHLPFTSLAITVGCFIGIVLGDSIGQNIIDGNLKEINELTSKGVNVSIETLNQADIHKGVFIWFGTIIIFMIIGLIVDKLHKRKIKRTQSFSI